MKDIDTIKIVVALFVIIGSGVSCAYFDGSGKMKSHSLFWVVGFYTGLVAGLLL